MHKAGKDERMDVRMCLNTYSQDEGLLVLVPRKIIFGFALLGSRRNRCVVALWCLFMAALLLCRGGRFWVMRGIGHTNSYIDEKCKASRIIYSVKKCRWDAKTREVVGLDHRDRETRV